MPVTKVKKLPRAKTPEEVGVSSAVVMDMLKEIEACGAEDHGFMIIRHGKVAAESFKSPYSADEPHIMYSVSKAVTATAVGFAVSESLLSLDDKVLDFFPEYRPKKRDEKLESLKVRHLITMMAGKVASPLANKTKDKWLNHFFDGTWDFAPGEQFRYVNENIFLLCAILVRVTGKSVVEFLTPRFWEPLGIETPFWETDHKGIEAGGWGLFISAESLAKITLCYLQKGLFEGKQVIPEQWAKNAVLNQKPTNKGESPNEENGYGYGIWRLGPDNKSYRLDGMFSQKGFIFENYDAVIVTVSGEMSEGKTHGYIFNNFPRGFIDSDPDAAPNEELAKALARACKPLTEKPHSKIEAELEGKRIKLRRNILLNIAGFPMSVLPLAATYMTRDRAGNINNITFNFSENECSMTWSEGDETNTVLCGMDGEFRKSEMRLATTDYTAFCCASWLDERTLEVWIIPIGSIGKRMLRFKFNGNKVQMKPSTTPDISIMVDNVTNSIKDFVKNKTLEKLTKKAMKKIEKIIEPIHKGRIMK